MRTIKHKEKYKQVPSFHLMNCLKFKNKVHKYYLINRIRRKEEKREIKQRYSPGHVFLTVYLDNIAIFNGNIGFIWSL